MGPRFLFKLHVVEKIIITTENSVNSVTLVHVYTSVLKSMNLLPTWPLKHERHQPGLNCDVIMFYFFSFSCFLSLFHHFSVGCGDHTLEEISLLPDPCPLPNAEKKRSLNEKERLIYAPMSGVGGVVYDKVTV